ncbi:MAG: M18 family aminopeptidase [Myxococcota bacterium]
MPTQTHDLLAYIDASPTPFHAVAETEVRLRNAGYRELVESEPWDLAPGDKVYIVRGGGSLAAFHLGSEPAADAGFRLVGAHTDSPNLRIKPNPERVHSGYAQLGVEPYGGVLLHTWLDRDLSLAGRVCLRDGSHQLIDVKKPVLRIPSLAIHLNREVNKKGLLLNAQKHLSPLAGLAPSGAFDFTALLEAELDGAGADDVAAWDLMTYDTQPSALGGTNDELVQAPRLDNLASCHAACAALLATSGALEPTRGIVLYDHEEVGSRSAQGAASDFVRSALTRLCGSNLESYHRAIAQSFLVSADMAHAVHPNYADVHEPQHQPVLGGGPVIKINVNQSYATDGQSWASFEGWAREAEVPTQRYVVRSDMGCGSTIGPITAAELGIRTADVGNPMLSMHSCREVAAAADVPRMIAVLERFFASA